MALSALPAMAFGVPFSAFSIFWMTMAHSMTSHSPMPGGAFNFFPLFGTPFLLVGLGMLTSPLWAYVGAGRIQDAVTNKRPSIVAGPLATTGKSSRDFQDPHVP